MYNDYEDEYEEEVKEICPVENVDLLRLYYCGKSTRLGMVDQGFPLTMKRLAAMRLVQPKDKGHVVTEEGFLFLDKWREKVKKL